MRIGVYGGSFDPVHFGHLVPVEEARLRLSLDEILFVPAFQPPHKPTGTSAPSHHRFAMLALALEAYPAFRLTDFEVARGGTTYTIETLRHLRAARADAEFVLVLGSDSLALDLDVALVAGDSRRSSRSPSSSGRAFRPECSLASCRRRSPDGSAKRFSSRATHRLQFRPRG